MNTSLTIPNEWQHRDNRCGLLFPWYTETFLEELKGWDVRHWRVLEWGSGASTLWWGKNAREVISVESDPVWHANVKDGVDELGLNVDCRFAKDAEAFTAPVREGPFDCIIIDGYFRPECAAAISASPQNIKDNGILILDNFENWREISEVNLFRINEMRVYPQTHHYYWRTAYWTARNKEYPTNDHEKNSKAQSLRRSTYEPVQIVS